jgi:D-threo-aldose 1-dehydrogenase
VNPGERRALGRTGVELTRLGFGGAPIGELFVRVSDETAAATLRFAWEAGVRYFDTSPFYGMGLSEHRVGDFARGVPRSDVVLSTKVGRVLRAPARPDRFERGVWAGGLEFDHVFDYGYDGIMRSYEDSLQRLGLSRVDLLLIHDLDSWHHVHDETIGAYMAQLATSGWRALDELRSAGLIGGIGAGLNDFRMMPRFLDLFDLDCFLLAMGYTLLEQGALDEALPRCAERNVGVIAGAVFNSGILATGAVRGAKYNYADAPPEVMARVDRIAAVCRRHGVPLPAAALQFPLGHPVVASVIPGAFEPEHVASHAAQLSHPIPPDLWAELKSEGLLREDAPCPD